MNYFPKIGVVEIELFSGQLKNGQQVIFENQADLFYQQKIESMQIEQLSVDETPIASSENHVVVSMKTNQALPRNANLYIYEDITP